MGAVSDLQIAQPLTLKSGLTLPNRLVKAALAEQLAGVNHLPDERLQNLYKNWSTGGWGMILTGTSLSLSPPASPRPTPPNTNQATSTSTTPISAPPKTPPSHPHSPPRPSSRP